MKAKKSQLFLLHFAGGSCYSFDFLRKELNADIEFIPLEIPGRGKRFEEELLKDKNAAIQDYFNQIKKSRNDQPYLIFGHSMGATLGLSVAKLMEKLNDPPCHLIVSGNPGPDAGKLEKDLEKGDRYLMNDDDFKEELRELGGVPEEVIENDELYGFFSPILRADFELLEKDDFSEKGTKLQTPICALMGSEEDYNVKIENWKRFTTSQFQFKILEGDHFFINDHPKEITNLINVFMKSNIVYSFLK